MESLDWADKITQTVQRLRYYIEDTAANVLNFFQVGVIQQTDIMCYPCVSENIPVLYLYSTYILYCLYICINIMYQVYIYTIIMYHSHL